MIGLEKFNFKKPNPLDNLICILIQLIHACEETIVVYILILSKSFFILIFNAIIKYFLSKCYKCYQAMV
jgi:hypothetical protein